MQSAPSEVFRAATSVDNTSTNPSSFSQHGLSTTDEQSSDGSPFANVIGVPAAPIDDTDNASITSSSTRRGRRVDTGRINRTTSSEDSSPGSRIEAYEKADSTPRKLSDGMVFQIVPNASGTQNNISILDFPNGRMPCHTAYITTD